MANDGGARGKIFPSGRVQTGGELPTPVCHAFSFARVTSRDLLSYRRPKMSKNRTIASLTTKILLTTVSGSKRGNYAVEISLSSGDRRVVTVSHAQELEDPRVGSPAWPRR